LPKAAGVRQSGKPGIAIGIAVEIEIGIGILVGLHPPRRTGSDNDGDADFDFEVGRRACTGDSADYAPKCRIWA
jgi:hypothetical protein